MSKFKFSAAVITNIWSLVSVLRCQMLMKKFIFFKEFPAVCTLVTLCRFTQLGLLIKALVVVITRACTELMRAFTACERSIIFMDFHVFQQADLSFKAAVTVTALYSIINGVTFNMSLVVSPPYKAFPTQRALVWLLSCVSFNMTK